MQSHSSDAADYRFLTAPAAALTIRLAVDERGQPELQVFGNRAGLLSKANVLLWLAANAWRREFWSLAELPFAHVQVPLALSIRLLDAEATGLDSLLCRLDRGRPLEWVISEDALKQVALLVHRLASGPAHEYDLLQVAEGSAATVHVRMTDAAQWLK